MILPDLASRRQYKARDYDDDETVRNPFHERRRALCRSISAIRNPQRLYMNGINHLLDKIDPILLADHPENIQLWLPSDLPPSHRDEYCTPGLPSIEYRLRYATAMNALQDVRRFRRYSQAITAKTRSHISNTNKTRTSSQHDKIQRRINRAAATYRAALSAIKKLDPEENFGLWKTDLRELRKEDIRGPAREGTETSESHHVPSWIWQTSFQASASANDKDFYAALQVEWCKAQERAARYEEEVQLVVEEMRRTLTYFEWLAREWKRRAVSSSVGSSGIDGATRAGISAYAYKQAAVYHKLVDVFVNDWYQHLQQKDPDLPWLGRYDSPLPAKRGRLLSNIRLYHSGSDIDDAELEQDLRGVGSDPEEPDLDDDDFFEEIMNG
jgi:hypothetical protein